MGAGEVWVSPHRFRGPCAGDLLEICRRTRTPVRLLRDGQRLRIGDLEGEVLLAGVRFRRAAENNSSVVLRLDAGGRRILLTGDIEKEAELALADRDLRADLLKVAHHGSRSSTSDAILSLVHPRVAVISCGRTNPFGHPHPSVTGRLGRAGIRTWRTDRDRTIDAEVRGGRLYVHPSFD
jgi:competence protein ComEC